MATTVLVDAGPLVALLAKRDAAHEWAIKQFNEHAGPFLTCEAVVSETIFLLRRSKVNADGPITLLERGVLRIGMHLDDEQAAVTMLFRRYDNVPASLADACLIRMSELHEPCAVLTLDSDFHVYRRHGRRTIPLIRPASESR